MRRAFTLVELLVCISILAVLVGLALPAVQRVRETAHRAACMNKMKQIGLALHLYHDHTGRFPQGYGPAPFGFPATNPANRSWLSFLLPHLEQDALYALGYPEWDSHEVKAFQCPSDPGVDRLGNYQNFQPGALTSYIAVFDSNAVLYPNSKTRLDDIRSGTSNVAAIGERPPSPDPTWGWWAWGMVDSGLPAGGMPWYTGGPVACFDTSWHAPRGWWCDVLHFYSMHPGGGNWAFMDGSVRFLTYDVRLETMTGR